MWGSFRSEKRLLHDLQRKSWTWSSFRVRILLITTLLGYLQIGHEGGSDLKSSKIVASVFFFDIGWGYELRDISIYLTDLACYFRELKDIKINIQLIKNSSK